MISITNGKEYFKGSFPLAVIGTFVILFLLWKCLTLLVRTIYSYILKFFELNVDWKSLGEWAVITGGSDGIGKAYAEELARRGFNILLISRTKEKLVSAANYIKDTYGVETEIICVDFSDNLEIYSNIKIVLDKYDIGVLVNNVGMSYKNAEYFLALPNGILFIEKLINTNIVSCTMMMRIVMPQMEKKRKGVVINLSSVTAVYPMPLLTVYSATKVYVDHLTRAVQKEYESKGIIIQSVLPAYVSTKMLELKKASLGKPLPETFVNCAIKTVGIEDYTYGYWPHKIRGYTYELMSLYWGERINMAIALHILKNMRNRYYRKYKHGNNSIPE